MWIYQGVSPKFYGRWMDHRCRWWCGTSTSLGDGWIIFLVKKNESMSADCWWKSSHLESGSRWMGPRWNDPDWGSIFGGAGLFSVSISNSNWGMVYIYIYIFFFFIYLFIYLIIYLFHFSMYIYIYTCVYVCMYLSSWIWHPVESHSQHRDSGRHPR